VHSCWEGELCSCICMLALATQLAALEQAHTLIMRAKLD
jgi:hypothetical protein